LTFLEVNRLQCSFVVVMQWFEFMGTGKAI